jgi:hypothetical protein
MPYQAGTLGAMAEPGASSPTGGGGGGGSRGAAAPAATPAQVMSLSDLAGPACGGRTTRLDK